MVKSRIQYSKIKKAAPNEISTGSKLLDRVSNMPIAESDNDPMDYKKNKVPFVATEFVPILLVLNEIHEELVKLNRKIK